MILLKIIKGVVHFWSFVTYPVYFILYQPWSKIRKFNRIRAERVGPIKNDEVVYRAIPYTSKGREYIIAKNLDTMDKIWKHSLLRHSKKRCLGTRKIIEEKKVPGPDGKLLTKLVMEPSYKWISYEEVDQKSTYIGRLVFQKSIGHAKQSYSHKRKYSTPYNISTT